MKKYIGLLVMFFIISCTVWSDDMAFNKKSWGESNFDEKIGTADSYRRMGDSPVYGIEYFAPTLTGYSHVDSSNIRLSGTTVQIVAGAGAGTYGIIPIILPNGAIVDELKAWINSDDTVTVTVLLARSSLNANDQTTMVSCSSSANATTEVTNTHVVTPEINNLDATYFIKIQINGSPVGNLFVHGIRIHIK